MIGYLGNFISDQVKESFENLLSLHHAVAVSVVDVVAAVVVAVVVVASAAVVAVVAVVIAVSD